MGFPGGALATLLERDADVEALLAVPASRTRPRGGSRCVPKAQRAGGAAPPCRHGGFEVHAPPSVSASGEGASAPAPTVGARLGLRHGSLPSLDSPAVQARDRLLGLGVRCHLDEAEAARAPAVAVGDDRGGLAGTYLGKECFQVRTRRLKGQVSYKQLLTHVSLLVPLPRGRIEFRHDCKSERPTPSTTQRSRAPTKGL